MLIVYLIGVGLCAVVAFGCGLWAMIRDYRRGYAEDWLTSRLYAEAYEACRFAQVWTYLWLGSFIVAYIFEQLL